LQAHSGGYVSSLSIAEFWSLSSGNRTSAAWKWGSKGGLCRGKIRHVCIRAVEVLMTGIWSAGNLTIASCSVTATSWSPLFAIA